MSYIATEQMLSFLVKGQEQFHKWAEGQRRQTRSIAVGAVLDKILSNSKIRLESFRDALSQSDTKTLETQLQYDGSEEIRQVLDDLPSDQISDPQEIEAVASGYYGAVLNTLKESEHVSEATPAKLLFRRLLDETESTVTNDAWASRGLP